MADTMQAAPEVARTEEAPGTSRWRLDRETLLMLVVPPILVAIVFVGYVVWRQTAELDAIEQSQLAWGAIRTQIIDHLQLTIASSLIVVLIAVPLGVLLTRGGASRFTAPVAVGFANIGQAAPSIGLLTLLFILLNDSFVADFWISVIGLSIYGLLPVLRNTITGLEGVDPTLVEAGRGLGMSSAAVLFRIELPLALPVILTGIRTALVLVVGTATLATFIGGGGLGDVINSGITLFRFKVMVAGAILVALLALLVEWLGRLLEVVAKPKGL